MKRKSSDTQSLQHKPWESVTLETFERFFKSKVFDVIGNGSYKPYIIKCKDNNDMWAIDTYKAINIVSDTVKHVTSLLYRIQSLPNVSLSTICKEITCNTTPPMAMGNKWAVCFISGEHSKNCVRLLRGGVRCGDTVYIHEKYYYFIKQLWYVSKIEHVIRSITRNWLDTHDVCDLNMVETCNLFETEFRDIRQHYDFFIHSMECVDRSLKTYIQHFVFDIPIKVSDCESAEPLPQGRQKKRHNKSTQLTG